MKDVLSFSHIKVTSDFVAQILEDELHLLYADLSAAKSHNSTSIKAATLDIHGL